MIRIGLGYDLHRLTEGRKLILGGVQIPFEKARYMTVRRRSFVCWRSPAYILIPVSEADCHLNRNRFRGHHSFLYMA